jgi:tRNA(fMet)-specific endonuclease VapC
MKYLLDTNICIYIIKRRPDRAFERFKGLRVGDVGVSSITYAELAYGVANSSDPDRNQAALDEFLGPLEVLDFPAAAAPTYGRLRAHLRRLARPIGPLDTFIAAHALYLGTVLVTNNVREFSRVPRLTVENWV